MIVFLLGLVLSGLSYSPEIEWHQYAKTRPSLKTNWLRVVS